MSWDKWDYYKYSPCACGNGRVAAHWYEADDDWGRHEEHVSGYIIECPMCVKKYHVDSITRHYFCYPWDGSGFVTHCYLVPNDMVLPKVIVPEYIQIVEVDEEIASKYTKKALCEVISDMKSSEFSTRVQLEDSEAIICICKKRIKTQALGKIIPLLSSIVEKYGDYKWNPQTVAEFRKQEQQKIDANEKAIEHVISNSFELTFSR